MSEVAEGSGFTNTPLLSDFLNFFEFIKLQIPQFIPLFPTSVHYLIRIHTQTHTHIYIYTHTK